MGADMSDSLPETQEAETPKKRHLWVVVVIGAVLLTGLVYGVYRALPNLGGSTDYARFKTASLASLEVLPTPPLQPVATFFDAQAKPITLANFRGKVVLVNLWATWCAPCVMEMPTLSALQGKFDPEDFVVAAISVDRDDTRDEAITQLASLTKGKLDFYHDPKMAVVFPMKARGFPTSILYDRSGREIARLAGEADWNSAEAQALITAALAEK
jgi:thiol-disulfide isomerase/thioredoxin